MAGVWHQAGCCCPRCEFCSEGTPSTMTIVVTGWSDDCGCVNSGGVSSFAFTDVFDLDGTYVLRNSEAAKCVWTLITPGVVVDGQHAEYSDNDCNTGVASGNFQRKFRWELTRNITGWNLQCGYGLEPYPTAAQAFWATATEDAGDCDPPVMTNMNGGACSIEESFSWVLSGSGTATITAS